MFAARDEALEIRAKCMEIEQEDGRGVASEGTRTKQEREGAPKGVVIPLKEQLDDDVGLNPEIKSTDDVLADESAPRRGEVLGQGRSWSGKVGGGESRRPELQALRHAKDQSAGYAKGLRGRSRE